MPHFRYLFFTLWVLWPVAHAALAEGPLSPPLLSTNQRHHVRAALHCMNMSEKDLRFAKDFGEPLAVLPAITNLLAEPLALCAVADRCQRAIAADSSEALWDLSSALLEVSPKGVPRASEDYAGLAMPWDWLAPPLAASITRFFAAGEEAQALVTVAFADIAPRQRSYMAARYLASAFDAEDRPAVRYELGRMGVVTGVLAQVIREEQALNPEPSARAFLDVTRKMKVEALIAAARRFHAATARLANEAAGFDVWPGTRQRLYTPYGDILIGTRGDDVYREPALLILDPGGDDRYQAPAGVANGLLHQPLAALVDVGGDDRFVSARMLSPGAALFGLSVVIDSRGDDRYAAEYAGHGLALFGCAWVEDRSGRDRYEAWALGQGAAVMGVATLVDRTGDDRYDVGLFGQGFSGFNGVGMLVDREGSDRYVAGGRKRDHGRNDDRYLALAQGMSMGTRPFFGGGYALLADLSGDDSYHADVFGQGVGYWYAVGMLLDGRGNDRYANHQYGQGTGIHLSLGLLADHGGDDAYTSSILAQGSAHDYAVGMLIDRSGNDHYRADEHAQGRGMNNGAALLLDGAGDDAYLASRTDRSQGIGNDGGTREYGSLGLLVDIGGVDRYSCGARDGARMLRPDFGVVYDFEEEPVHGP